MRSDYKKEVEPSKKGPCIVVVLNSLLWSIIFLNKYLRNSGGFPTFIFLLFHFIQLEHCCYSLCPQLLLGVQYLEWLSVTSVKCMAIRKWFD